MEAPRAGGDGFTRLAGIIASGSVAATMNSLELVEFISGQRDAGKA